MTIAKSIFCLFLGLWSFSISFWVLSPKCMRDTGGKFAKAALECADKAIAGEVDTLDSNVGGSTNEGTDRRTLRKIHLATKVCLSHEKDEAERERLQLIESEIVGALFRQRHCCVIWEVIAIAMCFIMACMTGIMADLGAWD